MRKQFVTVMVSDGRKSTHRSSVYSHALTCPLSDTILATRQTHLGAEAPLFMKIELHRNRWLISRVTISHLQL